MIGGIKYGTHWDVLYAQLLRVLLFNIFGTFVGVEQSRQMRLNFWQIHLLQEALELHKMIRQRFHRLTTNTLPEPIVKAIAEGKTHFVKTYQDCTVLQADMVGCTRRSPREPAPQALALALTLT